MLLLLVGLTTCGEPLPVDISQQPIAGSNGPETGYPATGMLKLTSVTGNTFYCTGTLIRADAVLSAAHCVFDENAEFEIRSTQFMLGASTSAPYEVSRIHYHPDYPIERKARGYATSNKYDVAIFFLKKSVRNVRPAAMSSLGDVR